MSKMSKAHTLDFKKDPQADRRAMIGAMKTFKGGEFPSNPFKDSSPKSAHDEPYHPHTGEEKV